MANEISATVVFSATKDGFTHPFNQSFQATWATGIFVNRSYALTTSPGNLDLGNIAAIGYILFYNADSTNNALIGSDGSIWQIIVPPLTFVGPILWSAAAINAKSSASTVRLQALILNT
jgi:hypothetical protein